MEESNFILKQSSHQGILSKRMKNKLPSTPVKYIDTQDQIINMSNLQINQKDNEILTFISTTPPSKISKKTFFQNTIERRKNNSLDLESVKKRLIFETLINSIASDFIQTNDQSRGIIRPRHRKEINTINTQSKDKPSILKFR